MTDAVGNGDVAPETPSILTIILELVVEDIGGDVQRSLSKRGHLAQQEVCEGLLEVEWTGGQSCRAANGRVGICRGNVGCIERVQTVVVTGQLVLMLVVVVVDGTEFEGVATENLGDVAVDGVIDVVIAVGTERVDGGAARICKCAAGKRQARNTANNVFEWQRAA